jgi:hypothetical protein
MRAMAAATAAPPASRTAEAAMKYALLITTVSTPAITAPSASRPAAHAGTAPCRAAPIASAENPTMKPSVGR